MVEVEVRRPRRTTAVGAAAVVAVRLVTGVTGAVAVRQAVVAAAPVDVRPQTRQALVERVRLVKCASWCCSSAGLCSDALAANILVGRQYD